MVEHDNIPPLPSITRYPSPPPPSPSPSLGFVIFPSPFPNLPLALSGRPVSVRFSSPTLAYGAPALLRSQILTPLMGTGVEVDEDSHHSCTTKVHHAMCRQLKTLVDKILRILPAIEAARPRCLSGIQALSLLQTAIQKAKLLLQNCTESSSFYLAITGDTTLSRFEKTQKQLEQSLSELQSMIPMNLELEVSHILDDLRRTVFYLDVSEEKAGKVVRALLQKDEAILSSFGNSEIRAVQFAASRLYFTSEKDLLVERRSIKKMSEKIGDSDQPKRKILRYLHHLLKKHDKLVLEWQPHYLSVNLDGSLSSDKSDKRFIATQRVDVESRLRQEMDLLHSSVPPEEFKCPLSLRLMRDPVVIASGRTYERVFIQKWFDDGNDTCPSTRMPLPDLSMMPNTVMRDLITKWCKGQGIDLYASTAQPSTFRSLETSYNSISSCGSLAHLNLQIDLSNLSLGSVDSCFNSGSFHSKNKGELGLSRDQTDNSPLELKFFSSTVEIEAGLLSNISQLPWELQCMAIEDAQSYLAYYSRSRVPLSRKNFMEPVVGCLKAAVDRQDMRAQIAGTQLILAGIHASRTVVRSMDGEVYSLLASFLGTIITGDVLAIFELSVERSWGTKLIQSGALSSVIKILDMEYKDFHESAIRILYKVSISEDPGSKTFLPVECIPRLSPFLKDSSLAGHCIVILEKLFYIEEARILALQTEGCIASIIQLLESGKCEEQELALSILLSLCTQYEGCSSLFVEEGITPSLFGIAVNGTEKSKVLASELLWNLRDVNQENEQEVLSSDDAAPRMPYNNSEDSKASSKQSRFFSKFTRKLKKW